MSDKADSGGNRPYDYISVEEFDLADNDHLGGLDTKYSELSQNQIVVLRSQFSALGIQKDIVDHTDKLGILKCLKYHLENRDDWHKAYDKLKAEKKALVEAMENASAKIVIGSKDYNSDVYLEMALLELQYALKQAGEDDD